jgi:hypothetical protein
MLVRKNQGTSLQTNRGRFPVRLGVAVPFLKPDASGMPSPDELLALARIEDLLCAEVEAEGNGVFTLAITTNGMREFVFYVTEAGWAHACVERVRAQVPDHQLQMYSEPDRAWQIYSEFEFTSRVQ